MSSRRRILSVRSRIVVWMLLVSAFGLASSGIASYLVQRESVLTAIDDKLLRVVDDVQDIASGATSGVTSGDAASGDAASGDAASGDATGQPAGGTGEAVDTGTAIPLTSVELVLHTAMRQLIPSANESMLGFVNGAATHPRSSNPPFRLTDSPELVTRVLSEANTNGIVLGTAQMLDSSSTPTDAAPGQPPFPATVRYIIIPVHVSGDDRSGLLAVAFDVDAELAAVTRSLDTYARVALGALVLVGLVAWLVAGRLLRPIRLLRDAAAGSSSAADLVERIPVTGHDDVSNLAEAINGMFDRLQQSSLSQQRLLDDVGHELKTPITIIRGQLEVLDASSRAEVEATRALAIEELDRMGSLLAGISLLAQSRAPHFVELATLDLAEFTAAVGAKARALDPGRKWIISSTDLTAAGVGVGAGAGAGAGVGVEVDTGAGIEPRMPATRQADAPSAAAPIPVALDADRITQAWLQLAANAARHSTPGSIIALNSAVTTTRPTVFTHVVPSEPGAADLIGPVQSDAPSPTQAPGSADHPGSPGSTGGYVGTGGPGNPGSPEAVAATPGFGYDEQRDDPPERWLCLSVRDAGPGIRLEAQPRIFDRFGRVENTRGAEGSGLGLSIVAAIAHAHGGTVLLDSAAGSGSTFTILVPAGQLIVPDHPTAPRPLDTQHQNDPLDLTSASTSTSTARSIR
ncbi:sensor histidine kinase [Cryobacterium melibiosiphilum]|uniref:histidine kinase n=1 Tax=Cryobacterium melibiosiphilum TaxID=995039 RepID=A0A3A5MYG1_9MICO|nr:sensor histidine kinase [Cryobacterium melibiosiphilum]